MVTKQEFAWLAIGLLIGFMLWKDHNRHEHKLISSQPPISDSGGVTPEPTGTTAVDVGSFPPICGTC